MSTVIDDNIKNNHNINNTKYAYIKGNINVDNMTFGLRLAIKKSPKTNKFWVHYVDINENISGATYADDKIVKQASFRTADIVDDDSIVTGKSQEFSEKRDRYEAKQRYVDRRNAESRENAVGLSEEQTDALEWLARTRHEIHSSPERFRNPEAGGTTWNYFDDDSLESINNHLTSAGLEPIDFGDYTDIPKVLIYPMK